MEKLHFASDYMEGAHPEVLKALINTNDMYTAGYGEDAYSESAQKLILDACGCPGGEVRFMIGGTQTNAVVIDAVLRPYQGVIAAISAHIAVHEAGAIEYGGHKVLTCESTDGKLCASSILKIIEEYNGDDNREHMVMPGMVYISQPTEYGTLYSKKELEEISRLCRDNGLFFYIDGARLAYAFAAPENDVSLKELAKLSDAFYIGGTKCGLLFGEALVLPVRGSIPHFTSIIKQHGALLAKGRLLGVQFEAMFKDGLYERIGVPAVKSAGKIRKKLTECGYKIPINSVTNQVFFVANNEFIKKLRKKAEYGFMERVDDIHTVLRFAAGWSATEEKTEKLLLLIDEMSRNSH